jgi:hypothetical protein
MKTVDPVVVEECSVDNRRQDNMNDVVWLKWIGPFRTSGAALRTFVVVFCLLFWCGVGYFAFA